KHPALLLCTREAIAQHVFKRIGIDAHSVALISAQNMHSLAFGFHPEADVSGSAVVYAVDQPTKNDDAAENRFRQRLTLIPEQPRTRCRAVRPLQSGLLDAPVDEGRTPWNLVAGMRNRFVGKGGRLQILDDTWVVFVPVDARDAEFALGNRHPDRLFAAYRLHARRSEMPLRCPSFKGRAVACEAHKPPALIV